MLGPVNTNTMEYVPLVKELPDRKNCFDSGEVLKKLWLEGIATTSLLSTPSRYREGVICTELAGAADNS